MSITDKITKLNNQVQWFYSDEFNLDEAEKKYKESVELAKEIEKDLGELKNKIEIINKDFTK
ncbi:exodeoxyribonuclease VII small subunit [Candidatus Saccharibacteria bacterium]|nr:exodeoxyribonuclease VII small subunit [Candidatus Saccharibacteria bacterium]MBR6123091.1 exodeoxyribonuclease VII small subunit [Candidatus Saccharibacteria bacterium]